MKELIQKSPIKTIVKVTVSKGSNSLVQMFTDHTIAMDFYFKYAGMNGYTVDSTIVQITGSVEDAVAAVDFWLNS